MKIYLKFIVLLFFTTSNLWADDVVKSLIMPYDLVELAEKNHFSQIDDFYTNETTNSSTQPPFVWGHNQNKPEFCSVAFWCQKSKDSIEKNVQYYLLIAEREDTFDDFIIKDSIKFIRPGGLSLYIDTSLTLDKFVLFTDSDQHGPDDVKMTAYGIKTERTDGFIDIFYRYHGDWYLYSEYDW